MKTSTKGRARGGGRRVRPGRGAGSDGPGETSGGALMRKMFGDDPRTALPAWAKRAAELLPGSGAGMSFDRFADVLHSIVVMIDSAGDVSNCDVGGPGCYIDNFGSNRDRAEAFLLLLPIVERIMERPDAEVEKVSTAAVAAVKGKKIGKGAATNGA